MPGYGASASNVGPETGGKKLLGPAWPVGRDRALDKGAHAGSAPLPAGGEVAGEQHLDWLDIVLLCIFILGIYTHYTIQISARVPFPSAPAGLAGIVMLWRRRDQVTPTAIAAFLFVVLLYLLSILSASNLAFLGRRFNGLVQLVYSLTIGYAVFLTVTKASRRQISNIFLSFTLAILFGCLLEDYGGLRPLSDWVRQHIYSAGIYDADLRDMLLYGRVRPKLFASEPSSVTFAATLYSFIWLATSRWRWKLICYLGIVAIATVAIPGPTLVLMLLLVVPYELFLAGRAAGAAAREVPLGRLARIFGLTALLLGAAFLMATTIFSARLQEISAGQDPSFFYRVQGPPLAAMAIFRRYPFAGAGLTGEPFVEDDVVNVYVRSPAYSAAWHVVHPASELLINYFWLHWIYLGLVWGTITLAALSLWLKLLGVSKLLFCWLVWAILGQAAGAYVGPATWAVLFLTAACAVLYLRGGARAEVTANQDLPGRLTEPRGDVVRPAGASAMPRLDWLPGRH